MSSFASHDFDQQMVVLFVEVFKKYLESILEKCFVICMYTHKNCRFHIYLFNLDY